MENLLNCLHDTFKLNLIYTLIILTAADSLNLNDPREIIIRLLFNRNLSSMDSMSPDTAVSYALTEGSKPSLLIRMAKRLALYSDSFIVYIQSQFYEHTATSIASFSVLIIVVSIICCFIISLMREEERKIKEQYKKLNTGSSQSFIVADGHTKTRDSNISRLLIPGSRNMNENTTQAVIRSDSHKLHVIELRRETYFGLVRLLKPGCRTIVLLCDTQSRLKLLTKFYQCIYPYRKNKTLQFAFLLIEKNIGWYRDLLKLALNEKRDLNINPINCIGTVLVLNGFKKYFSVYHASDSRCDPDEPYILLEESLLDNLAEWLERLFGGKASRYYVKYWPDQMR